MSRSSSLNRIGEFFDVFGSAVAVSRALSSRKQPTARDLTNLGIDPAAFRAIRRS